MPTNPLKFKRGLEAARLQATFAEGEPMFTTDTKQLYVGDGTTVGGVGVAPLTHTHAAGDITSGVLDTARLGTGTPTSSNFLRGDGTWNVPAGGGGGSDGTIPLITQAYAVTEGYSTGDFNAYTLGNGYVRPVLAASYGVFVDRAGALEAGITSCAVNGVGIASSNTASIGGFVLNNGTICRSTVSQSLSSNTITAVVRVNTLPSASANFEAGVCFTDSVDFFAQVFGYGTLGICVWINASMPNWMVRYTGSDFEMGNIAYADFSTGVPKSTAWRTIQLITQTVGAATTYTIKIGGATVQSISRGVLADEYSIDMNGFLLSPHVAIRSAGNTASGGTIMVDHLSILSGVVR